MAKKKNKLSRKSLENRYPKADIDYLMMLLEHQVYLKQYEAKRIKDIDRLFKNDYLVELNNIYAKHFSDVEKFGEVELTNKKNKFLKDWNKLRKRMHKSLLENAYQNMSSIYNYCRFYFLWMLDELTDEIDMYSKPDVKDYLGEQDAYVGEQKKNKKKKLYDIGYSKDKLNELIDTPRYGKTTSERIAYAISKTDIAVKGVLNDALIPKGSGKGKSYLQVMKQLEKSLNDNIKKLAQRSLLMDIQGISSQVNLETYRMNDGFLPDKFQRVEVLDKRTCLVCAKLDGTLYKEPKGQIHPNCFPEGVMVTTLDGDKDISEIKVGDVTYTHNGNWKRVVRLFQRYYEGNLVKITLSNNKFLIATPNHKIRVLSNGEEVWKEIGKLAVGDKVLSKG